jgi:MFS family permease
LGKENKETGSVSLENGGLFYGYVTVVLAFLILTVIFVATDVFGVFFKPLIMEFNWSRTIISGASALNNLAFGVFCVISARLCEKFNPRLIVGCCALILGLSYLLMSIIDSPWQLYLYYGILMSVGMSIYIAIISMVAHWFVKRRGLMTGIVFSGLGLAAAIGPPAADWLISVYDWRQALLILGIVSMIIMVPASQFLKRVPKHDKRLSYVASVRERAMPVAVGLSMNKALRTRQFWLLCGMYFVFLFCFVMVLVHIVIHAIGLGISPANAANIIAIYGVVSIVSVNIMGMCGDRFGNRPTFAASFLLLAIAFFWLLAARETWELYLFAVILGIAYGGMQVLFSPLVAELFGLKSHGVILGSAAFGGSIGAALGPLFAGYIFDETGSYTIIFIICASLAMIAVVMTLLIGGWSSRGSAGKF